MWCIRFIYGRFQSSYSDDLLAWCCVCEWLVASGGGGWWSAPTLTAAARLNAPDRPTALLEYATLWHDGWHPSVPSPNNIVLSRAMAVWKLKRRRELPAIQLQFSVQLSWCINPSKLCRDPVPISQITHCVSIAKSNWILLFREVNAVC
jgi:hypothetical protein